MSKLIVVLAAAGFVLVAARAEAQVAINCAGQMKVCPAGTLLQCNRWEPCRAGATVPKRCASAQCATATKKR
jgi:hypothetical protein